MGIGATELIVILIVVLLIFGPSRLPGLGKAVGETIRGFKKGMTDELEKPAQIVEPDSEQTAKNHQKSSEKSKS